MGRPATYDDDTVVSLTGKKAKSKLQQGSDRRAIINLIVDEKGRMTLKEIDDHFGFEIRPKVIALIHAGWLEVPE